MSSVAVLTGILLALLIGAASPGPSFVLVSRVSISASRSEGLAAAFGMGVGGAAFGALALLGLTALLLQVDWLYLILKLAGGGYLIFLGLRIWRGAPEPLTMPEPGRARRRGLLRAFSLAFFTQVSNPKTAIVYASIFAALLPASPPLWMLIALPPLIFCVEAGWYAAVALVFSARRPRAVYLASKGWIDRLAGTVMAALGLRLVIDGFKETVTVR